MQRFLLLITLLGLLSAAFGAERQAERDALMNEVNARSEVLLEVLGRDHLSEPVQRAMRAVPRHAYVPEDQRARAYENRPLPIGHGQTISQPLIVALMTDLLQLQPGDRVLELGTGSGYQAAILVEMGMQVFSVEIVPPLGERAKLALHEFAPGGVSLRIGDGYEGWPEAAPFDAIIVTAAGDHVPPPLVAQLKPGGRMVIPVGSVFFSQQLMLVTKDQAGTVQTRALLPVRFVPLTGGH